MVYDEVTGPVRRVNRWNRKSTSSKPMTSPDSSETPSAPLERTPQPYSLVKPFAPIVEVYHVCKLCKWRRQCIHGSGDRSDAPHWACDSACPTVLRGLHTVASQVWLDIIGTKRLRLPNLPTVRGGRSWLSIPLRCDLYVAPARCGYHFNGLWKAYDETVIGFHNTRLESLVRGTPCPYTEIPNGKGILVDGRLRYGSCTHKGNSGVNVYSDGGLETFNGFTGWVQLEVHCTNTTKLTGGRHGRYCVNGPFGQICFKAAIVALWVPLEEVPPMVFLS